MTKPYITVITSTHNAASTLKRCLDSVESQPYPAIEHIIIDGNSTDGTQDIIAEYASKPESRISYWKSEPDSGIYDAWNKALPHINGEWVLFLGADDYYLEDVFSKVVPILYELREDVVIAYAKVLYFNEYGGNIMCAKGKPWPYHKKGFFKGVDMLPHQGVFHKSALFRIYGGFNVNYRIASDYDYLYPIVLETDPTYVDISIAMCSDGGVSGNLFYSCLSLDESIQTIYKYGMKPSVVMTLARIKYVILLFCKSHNLNTMFRVISKISLR